MASEVADYHVSKCGLRPRCSGFPRAKTLPYHDEGHGGREVLLAGYKNKPLQSLDINKENSRHVDLKFICSEAQRIADDIQQEDNASQKHT